MGWQLKKYTKNREDGEGDQLCKDKAEEKT